MAHSGSSLTATVLYDYERTRQALTVQNQSLHTLTTVGLPGLTANPAAGVGFDIFYDAATATNAAFVALAPGATANATLYVVDLATGSATARGPVGAGLPLAGLAAYRRAEFYVWTGLLSSSWTTAANWLPPGVPTAANDVLIPRVPNQPVLTGGQQANNLLLDSTAVVTLSGGAAQFTLSGSLGNFYGSFAGTGELRFGGSGAQVLGGTALTVPNLTVGPGGLTLAGPLSVRGRLRLKGDLQATGFACVLRSDAAGTAYVANAGGTLSGPVTVERYIEPGLNAGSGYRHYSAPTSNARVIDLTTTGFAPAVNPAYNTAAAPGTVSPFPNVFGYNQARIGTATSNFSDFDKGWFSPQLLTSALAVGQGYAVQIGAAATVSFLGPLNQTDVGLTGLGRGPQAAAGWHLLGNPYPSPLNWDRALLGATGLEPALYVFQGASQETEKIAR